MPATDTNLLQCQSPPESHPDAECRYINYNDLKEFYIIPELCHLFQMVKGSLQRKCEQYDVKPRRNEIGDYGLVKYDVHKLHNAIYHEGDGRQRLCEEDDPWA